MCQNISVDRLAANRLGMRQTTAASSSGLDRSQNSLSWNAAKDGIGQENPESLKSNSTESRSKTIALPNDVRIEREN